MLRPVLAAVLALSLAAPAWAHEVAVGPNGGMVADAGPDHHLELVVEDGRLVVFVTDAADRPVTLDAAASGEAMVLIGQENRRVALQRAADDRLEGALALPEPRPALVVVATVTLADARPRARFQVAP